MSVKRSDVRGTAVKALVDELKSAPCMDCAGQYPSEAMDWDHRLAETKLYDVGAMVGGRYSWDKIQAEIAKCDLVCSNCHRIRTKKRLNGDEFRFYPMPKIPRLSREIVVTEKIDGTNAVVVITGSGEVVAGSKSRWLRPKLSNMGSDPDNYGFAAWVAEHEEELYEGLGEGIHRGEWWGSGIQRGYGLTNGERHFSLFNTGRWVDRQIGNVTYIGDGAVGSVPKQGQQFAPVCCRVVPILYTGEFDTESIEFELHDLRCNGSRAAPGYMNPEGVVIFHTAANMSFKKTLEKDEKPKGSAE